MTAKHVGHHVELEEEEARAGQTGVHLRYILIFSTILVARLRARRARRLDLVKRRAGR
jgi:hypothetical protein